jgi:gamma-glutamyltranspeptidase/glutathione hydrolase
MYLQLIPGCHNSGIAGGGFALVRMPNNTFEVVDFREKAPAAAFTDMFKDSKTASQIGGNATYVNRKIFQLKSTLTIFKCSPWSDPRSRVYFEYIWPAKLVSSH